MLYPLTFQPILKERVWGGQNIERLYHKPAPAGMRIGESWEISDRVGDVSVIANGALAGRDLRWLMETHGPAVMGSALPKDARFPLLIKILDAQDNLSVQVHPTSATAAKTRGEPKTEMWHIAHAEPDAELYVGLKVSVTREEFLQRIQTGAVASCLNCVSTRTGDSIFIPSGQIHAIGPGNVIFEIQQNSDTTYRVYDWDRVGLDGQPRQLHVEESLDCMIFEKFTPSLIRAEGHIHPQLQGLHTTSLVVDPLFSVRLVEASGPLRWEWGAGGMAIIGVAEGQVSISHNGDRLDLEAGGFGLLPACLKEVELETSSSFRGLYIQVGKGTK